jgi:hypothetical protein
VRAGRTIAGSNAVSAATARAALPAGFTLANTIALPDGDAERRHAADRGRGRMFGAVLAPSSGPSATFGARR